MKDIAELFAEQYGETREQEMPLQEYLNACRDDPSLYANVAERMLKAIGEEELVDTSKDARLGPIFQNRTIKRYSAFHDFYGMEDTIERIVGYFRHAAQGLEERKQILYLLGPVGGGKSSLAERLKRLVEDQPIYVLKAGDQISPIFESPLGLFDPVRMGKILEEEYGIVQHRLPGLMSPWAVQRLDEFDRDINKFSVVRIIRRACAASVWPRSSRGMRTIRTSLPWLVRSISASWSISARTTRTPTASPAA